MTMNSCVRVRVQATIQYRPHTRIPTQATVSPTTPLRLVPYIRVLLSGTQLMITATPEARILCVVLFLCPPSVLILPGFSPLLHPHNSWRRVSIPPIRRLRILKTQRPCQNYLRLVIHPKRVGPQATDGECQRRLEEISVRGGDMSTEECA
jgi:hypothetical protein